MCGAKPHVRFAPKSGSQREPLMAEAKFAPSHNAQRIALYQLLRHEVIGADNLAPELDLAR
jgi:hypothetical protein